MNIISPKIIKQIKEIVGASTCYPNMQRKKKIERIKDNLKWYNEYGYVNLCYNEYGLDIENFRNQDDYIERYIVKEERKKTHHGSVNPNNHRFMVTNKMLFYAYMEKVVPGLTEEMLIILNYKKLFYPMMKYKNSIEALNDLANGKYVCKPIKGNKGARFFVFEKRDNFFYINNEIVEVEDLIEKTRKVRYLVQSFINQHVDYSRIAPGNLNTIRIETLRFKNTTHIFYAVARFSAKEGVLVDNASQGGTFVGVDIERGVLRKHGEYFDNIQGLHEKTHPISGVTYKDFEIPQWKEVIKLVKKLHPLFSELSSIGWDIAITENGPMVIEANAMPCTRMAQIANGGLKQRFYELKEK